MSVDTLSPLAKLKLHRKPFPLTAYLTLIHSAPEVCYTDYLEGASLLLNWLTNDGEVPLEIDITATTKRPHPLLYGYYQQQLASLLAGNRQFGAKYAHMSSLVYNFLISKTAQELNL